MRSSIHYLDFAVLMITLRRRIYRGQQLNTPDRNFNFLFTTRGPVEQIRIQILLYLYQPFPFIFPNQRIGRLIQTSTVLFCVIDSWQVVLTPSVAQSDSAAEEASDLDDPWN